MTRGVLDTIGLVATLVVAVPIAYMGAEMAFSGRPLGYVLLVVAGLAVVVEEYATRPTDVPGSAASRLVGAVAKSPGEDED